MPGINHEQLLIEVLQDSFSEKIYIIYKSTLMELQACNFKIDFQHRSFYASFA